MRKRRSLKNCCNIRIDHFDRSTPPKELKRKRSSVGSNEYDYSGSTVKRSKYDDDDSPVKDDMYQRRRSGRVSRSDSSSNEFCDGMSALDDSRYNRYSRRSWKLDGCTTRPARRSTKLDDSWSGSSGRENSSVQCKACRQMDTIEYGGPPVGAKKEKDLAKIKELIISEVIDEKPQYRFTQYSVYDKFGHLCPFDGKLILKNVSLYFSGYVKPIFDENPETTGGFPCKSMGPITEWWVAGYSGGQKAVIGISSEIGDYYLMQPSDEYAPFMKNIDQKTFLTKTVIDFLEEADSNDESAYDNLIIELLGTNPPDGLGNLTERDLLANAEFVYEQIQSYDSTADPDDKLLSDSFCVKTLIKNAKLPCKYRLQKTSRPRRPVSQIKDRKYSKATTTRLVQNVFESVFQGQMNKGLHHQDKIRGCVVKLTRLEDLGWNLVDGHVKLPVTAPEDRADKIIEIADSNDLTEEKQTKDDFTRTCTVRVERLSEEILRKYLKKNGSKKRNRKKKVFIDDYSESDEEFRPTVRVRKSRYSCSSSDSDDFDGCYNDGKNRISRNFENRSVTWKGESIMEVDDRLYFGSAQVGDKEIKVGDFVTTYHSNSVAHVKYMWENEYDERLFHAHWFMRSEDTVLGEVGNPNELFLSEECEDVPLKKVIETVNVTFLPIMPNWSLEGNVCLSQWTSESKSSSNDFFYQKRFNNQYARFEDLEEQYNGCLTDCRNCEKLRKQQEREIPIPNGKMTYHETDDKYILKMVRWRDQKFRVGSCVFLTPGTIMKIQYPAKENRDTNEIYDEDRFPEKYRRTVKDRCNQDEDSREPFDIGYIEEISSKSQDIKSVSDVTLKLKKLYRPHNTCLERDASNRLDLNLVYWSDEDVRANFQHVQGKCYLAYEKNIDSSVHDWTNEGPYRFYFNQSYNRKTKTFMEPPSFALNLGKIYKNTEADADVPTKYPTISRPLRSLDVFAGCGGLTEGLHQANIADCRWAIEKDEAAAHAFRLNYPNAAVFTEDCNKLLNEIINGEMKKKGLPLPKKGDVELMCGGPPCQGYSGMNRFNKGQCSQFNNSLIVSYLSYCDYYRPRFFILENVRNFVRHAKSMVLKLTLNCLVKMGYQVTFGVLQSGHFGIPQSRRRAIILAAAPGEVLPMFPEPTNAFTTQSSHLQVTINEIKYTTNCLWTTSAPYRMITVYDAISDLPPIKNGEQTEERAYVQKPLTHFQRIMREVYGPEEQKVLIDHICKQMSALVEMRMSYIPRKPRADWRDLPNIVVQLSDGSYTKKLKYTHHDMKYGKSSKGSYRGVCCCASKIKCKPEFRQGDTLIPWCLPHTGSRHGQWAGLYGRLGWDDYFRTVVTNPEPMGKQGRVLHPVQDRVFSVKECARSQGFPDRFLFYGHILDKHRQIGNAVAPPLAKAIAMEIKKSVSFVESSGSYQVIEEE